MSFSSRWSGATQHSVAPIGFTCLEQDNLDFAIFSMAHGRMETIENSFKDVWNSSWLLQNPRQSLVFVRGILFSFVSGFFTRACWQQRDIAHSIWQVSSFETFGFHESRFSEFWCDWAGTVAQMFSSGRPFAVCRFIIYIYIYLLIYCFFIF